VATDKVPESGVILDVGKAGIMDIAAMIRTEPEILQFLSENHFNYQRVEHPPVYSCAEAERLRPNITALSTKNLFLCDKKGRKFYLAVTACEKNMDFKQLADQFGVPRLRFSPKEDLERLLGVNHGAVTMLGLVNDLDHQVELWIEAQTWSGENFLCHPLVNTATLVLSKSALVRFFNLTGHIVHTFEEKSIIGSETA
jgi:Ala-tRNA(Pro) deacylase